MSEDNFNEPVDEARAAEGRTAERQEKEDWRWLVGDPRGRRIVRHILDMAGVFRGGFSADGLLASFREGERNLGLRVIDLILTADPDQLPVVMRKKD